MNKHNIAIGIMSALLACTGGAILIIQVAEIAGFSRIELISWMFAVYFLGGILNLVLTLKYRVPFGGAHSITAVAFLASTAAQYSIQELAGGYIISGIIIAVLGLSGLFNKVLDFIPKPFIDALFAGIILNYVVKIVPAVHEMPFIGGLAIMGFIISYKMLKGFPPFMGVLVFGLIGLLISYDFPTMQHMAFSLPQPVLPSFTVNALLSISIPVSVLILSNDIAVGLAALKSNGFNPPVNKTLALTGLFTSCAGIFAGHAVNIGGMMSALCSGEEAGPKDKRIWAAIISSIIVILFGLFAWKVIDIIGLLPSSFVVLITGFSLLGILLNSVQSAFSNTSLRYSVMFTFIIAISNISFAGISSSSIRWLSGVAWCGGFGALSAVTADILIPYAQLHKYSAATESFLYYLKIYSSLLQNYGLPYCFVMFAISYNPIISERWRKRLVFILLLPILAMGLLFDNYPVPKTIAALWAIPYVLSGAYIVFRKKENLPSLHQNHRFTSLAVLPAVLLSAILNFVMPFFGLQEMWRYNTWIILFAAIVFVVAIFNYGFMGIQFIIHKRKMEFTFRTITSGTSILNHAIKNDVGKMKLYCDKIKTYAEESNQMELASDVQVILSATRHIQDMIQRVHQQTQEIDMRMEPCDLTQLIEQMVAQAQPLLINIHVNTTFHGQWKLNLDPVHIAEVFNNLVTNAVEAMPQGGELRIRAFETKKLIMIQVKDSGTGIEKQHLKLVLEPFFTTKNRMNFGLGLTYCYNVMKKHGGNLELNSEVGKGTSVYLSFPKRRIYGKDQSADY